MTIDFSHIVFTPGMLSGSPRIDGRRLAVGDVVSFVKNYGPLNKITNDYELTITEIRQALQYCSAQQCIKDKPLVFCHNCSLQAEQEGPLDISGLEEIHTGEDILVKGENFIFLGSMSELLESHNGQNWWTIATDLLIDLRHELINDSL